VRFIGGALTEAAVEDFARHLDDCADCRAIVGVAAHEASADGDGGPTHMGESFAPLDAPVNGDWLGRYQIAGLIGAGAMGSVYAARDPELDREVAVKVVRADAATSEARRQRVIREARAMALVSHPNVVPVYDVGQWRGTVFIVMERVQGMPLHRWCGGRSWTEIVACFIACGRGLAEAHRAGLTHRDFKPSNVLVGDDGRPRVIDFGLVAAFEQRTTGTTPEPASDPVAGSEDNVRLTQTGIRLGTPAYMSPEQFSRDGVTAAADQFSFCVSLVEALTGSRPTTGRTVRELSSSAHTAAERVGLGSSGAPGELAECLRRGLAADPANRFVSMDALVQALERVQSRPARARRRWMSLAAISTAGIAVLAFSRSDDRCVVDGEPLATNVASADATVERLLADRSRYREQAADRVASRLARFAGDWQAARRELCDVDEVIHVEWTEHSARCLEQHRRQYDAVLDVLRATPPSAAVLTTEQLGQPRRCLDLGASDAGNELPPVDLRAGVARVEAELVRVRALAAALRFDDARAHFEAQQDQLRAMDWPPLLANALAIEGSLERHRGEHVAERAKYEEAYQLAIGSGQDHLAAETASSLIAAVARGSGDHEEAERWFRRAEAIAERLDSDELRARAQHGRALMLVDRSRFAEARAAANEALEHYRADTTSDHAVDIGSLQGVVGQIGLMSRDTASAKAGFQAQLETYRDLLGEGHPSNAGALLGLAQIAESERDWDEAERLLDQRRAIVLDAYGEDSLQHARDLAQRSFIAEGRGDLEAAIDFAAAALAKMSKVFGDAHPELARRNGRLGVLYGTLGKSEESRRFHARALAQCLDFAGEASACAVTHRSNLGEALLRLERYDEAQAELSGALEAADSVYGSEHPIRATALAGLGRIDLREGRYDRARQRLREATEAFGQEHHEAWSTTAFAFARALAEAPNASPDDVSEARELAQKVIVVEGENHENVRQWLATH